MLSKILSRRADAAADNGSAHAADCVATLRALSQSQAVIEFKPDGTIRYANENFLAAVGYHLDEIVGRHHSIFVTEEYRQSAEYRQFWERLRSGEAFTDRCKRITKAGKEIWIQATYNPVYDADGTLYKVIKFCSDATADELQRIELKGLDDAVRRTNAVLEFDLDGRVTQANDVFLAFTGLSREEIVGQAHSALVPAEDAGTPDFKALWQGIAAGRAASGEYRFAATGGEHKWLYATFNPLFDRSGRLLKAIMVGSDVTAAKRATDQTHKLLAEVSEVMQRVAAGDLAAKMSEGEGEFAGLSLSVNTSIENLRTMLGEARQVARSIKDSSEEVSSGNADLSKRTEEQAASLEETAASMEEMTSTVKQNAENARQANQLASGARDQAEQGGSVVADAVAAMSQINEASRKISDIIGVIDEIAFQTNLLALNAAVEAARAGEQGRGFAVVASEVRNLAQRSAGAAKEIKTLIKDSVDKVEHGSQLVDASGETLAEIVASVKKVSDIIAEIAAAGDEQSAGIEQVNQAIAQMDQVTQQNAALVEQVAASSASMDDQSRHLIASMEKFDVGEAVASAPRAAKPAPIAASREAAPSPEPAPAPVATATATADSGDERDFWEEF